MTTRWHQQINGLGDARELGHRADNVLSETFPRRQALGNSAILLSGRITVAQIPVTPGMLSSHTAWLSSSTAMVTPTNQWAALFDEQGDKLAVSNDELATGWTVSTRKAFQWASPYEFNYAGFAYLGLVVVAATPPSLSTFGISNTFAGWAPALCGSADTGLTTPASCPATLGAITSFGTIPYAQLRDAA